MAGRLDEQTIPARETWRMTMAFIEVEKTRARMGQFGAAATFTRTKKAMGA
jgi:hypothetical protein